ncbi:GYD domain-containing protein [Actinomycetospora lutea]|uniref:GYD domain-containing protein n=1 Tax=Actinomycetospora lutea TaxID=663604 RepID=UPI002367041B|nr:GYD domain-containing protein [Actinomycetospora lutea]MDD7942041.1 GYD domain-containing protein [Actinomycetospora lutea]
MAKYITFFSYTEETWAKMIANPSDRLAAVRASAQSLGGDVEALYYMFGSHDGFVISDLPDAAAAAGLSLAVNSTGAAKALETHEIFPSSELPAVLERAATVQRAYRTPGS